jgi:hypothetical protein
MFLQSLSYSLAKPIASVLLGGVILWQVAEHAGSSKGRAIVHVSTPKVEITVDDAPYWVESLETTPIVCDLTPGHHVVRMHREGRVLYQEEFSVDCGGEVILAAWEGYTDGRSPGQESDHSRLAENSGRGQVHGRHLLLPNPHESTSGISSRTGPRSSPMNPSSATSGAGIRTGHTTGRRSSSTPRPTTWTTRSRGRGRD